MFEGHSMPSEIPSSPAFPMPSGGVDMYCDKCYKDATGSSAQEAFNKPVEKKEGPEEKIKEERKKYQGLTLINDLKASQNATVIGYIDSEVETRTVNSSGQELMVGEVALYDETGFINLVLWNDDIGIAQTHKFFKIKGYVKEWNEELQFSPGKYGEIEALQIEPVK